MTPEGKVKRAIKRALDRHKDCYVYMPVPGGYGLSTLDYIICYRGKFIGIEAKAPGKKPTPRQKKIMGEIERAGGKVFLIDGDTTELEDWLNAPRTCEPETQSYRRAPRTRSEEPISRRQGSIFRRKYYARAAARSRRNLHAAEARL